MNNELVKRWPRHLFIHLFAATTLYTAFVGALTFAFECIDMAFGPANFGISGHDSICWGLALMTVFFPAYAWAWSVIEADLADNPEQREHWLHTAPSYATVLLASWLILSDLACLVYYSMNGELTRPFILKIVTALVLSGVVLCFYLYTLRGKDASRSTMSLISRTAVGIIGAAVLAGFIVAGWPGKARRAKADVARLEDLQEIQDHIMKYWETKAQLPSSLNQLTDSLSSFVPPRDPDSKKYYGYRLISPTSFQLCADFGTRSFKEPHPARQWPGYGDLGPEWNHDSGHFCFVRTIDPSRHPARRNSADES